MLKQIMVFIILLSVLVCIPNLLILYADGGAALSIAGDENYPPYEFVDDDGIYKGFNVDVIKAISRAAKLDIQLTPMSWRDAQDKLESGQVDAIQGMSQSIQRDIKFDFTEPLLHNSQVIFVRNETTNIVELQDLKGRTVAVQSGDINGEILKKIQGVIISSYSNQEQAIDALLLGKVDAFVGSKLTGIYVLQNMRQENKIKIVGEPLSITAYSAAVVKDNKRVLELLNQGLREIKKDGSYDQIYDKWFGEEVSNHAFESKRLVAITMFLLTLFAASVSMLLYDMDNVKKRFHWTPGHVNRLKSELLETVSEGVIACSKNGKIIVANQTAKDFLGFYKDEFNHVGKLKVKHGDIYTGCQKALDGELWQSFVSPGRAEDRVQELACRVFPVKNAKEKTEGIILILQDHTEGMLLSQEKEYNKLKTEFFANVSHEFRTPLSVIHAAVQLLQLNTQSENMEKLRSSVEKTTITIRQNINRLTRLIDNIIDATKADSGFIQLQLCNYNVIHIIEEATLSVAELAKSKGLTLEFDTEVEEKIIACDADKIERIILNLLSNSVKFTESGGSIYVKIYDGEENLGIVVKDTGIGIPVEQQKMVFERFRQIEKPAVRNHQGSGIGLYLVKSLIELHGGKINLQSDPGTGSEFMIQLPVKKLKEETTISGEIFNTKKAEIEFSDIYL